MPNQTFGQRLKQARKEAGMTQEALSTQLMVSRQAVTKWEQDKGMPDIENLKRLSKLLNVSLDHLLDNDQSIDVSLIQESIHTSGNWLRRAKQKDRLMKKRFANAEIACLLCDQVLTRPEKIMDNLLGIFTSAPFGLPQLFNSLQHMHENWYMVKQHDQQYLVKVTDDMMEIRTLTQKITTKRFVLGDFSYRFGIKLKR